MNSEYKAYTYVFAYVFVFVLIEYDYDDLLINTQNWMRAIVEPNCRFIWFSVVFIQQALLATVKNLSRALLLLSPSLKDKK